MFGRRSGYYDQINLRARHRIEIQRVPFRADAIVPDSESSAAQWVEMNREYASSWPNITRKGEPPPDADAWKGVANKFEKHFDPNPGKR